MGDEGVLDPRQATSDSIRVVLVDDSFLIREGLRQLLAFSDEVRVVAGCPDAESAMSAAAEHHPEVVVTDIRMPPTWSDEGLQLAERLRVGYPNIGIVLLSQEGRVDVAAQLLREGASGRGYLLKDRVHDLDHLVSTIVDVAHGECRIDPELIERLVRGGTRAASPLADLTPRQRELLADVAEGKSNAAIARDRYLSQRAVEKHISEIFSRLGVAGDPDVSRRVRATLLFLEESQK
jgi:DNA-binding NarL/FixJ family response regulator